MKKDNVNNVIIYLTDDENKNKAIKKYCKVCKYNVLAIVKPCNDTIGDTWDSGIFNLFNKCLELSKKHFIKNIITYSLDDFDYGLDSQSAICRFLVEAGAFVETIKEGTFFLDFNFNNSIESQLEKNEKEFLKKFWLDEDIK